MSRLERVAQARANVTKPIAVDPKYEEYDLREAEAFLAMLDAALEGKEWATDIEDEAIRRWQRAREHGGGIFTVSTETWRNLNRRIGAVDRRGKVPVTDPRGPDAPDRRRKECGFADWQENPNVFVREFLGITPTPWQDEALRAAINKASGAPDVIDRAVANSPPYPCPDPGQEGDTLYIDARADEAMVERVARAIWEAMATPDRPHSWELLHPVKQGRLADAAIEAIVSMRKPVEILDGG